MSTARQFAGQWSVTCKDEVEDRFIGGARPRYRRKGSKLDPHFLRGFIAHALNAAGDQARNEFEAILQSIGSVPDVLATIGCGGWSISQLIRQLHQPRNLKYADHARQAFFKLGALVAHRRMSEGVAHVPTQAIALNTLDIRIQQQTHTPTGDQRAALHDIAKEFARGRALRHLLAADVGCGKTLVASLIAAAVMDVDVSNRVLVMAPTTLLAAQFRDEFDVRCPGFKTALVTGDSSEKEGLDARIVFGTSAVLSRPLGQFALCILDEQHRWSRAQREKYVSAGSHLLELSATCIPRTQALAMFSRVTVSRMRETPFPKRLHTRLWEGEDASRRLMKGISGVIKNGRPVLVVYPKREKVAKKGKGKTEETDRHSIEAALPRWEKAFPGLVRAITSDNDFEHISRALSDIESGRARVLLSTLVVEVGIDIKGLRNIVISSPEHYGLATLHQLRGRVARQGGDGYCELLVTGRITDKTRQRLDAVLTSTDGFVLSELDMKLRGVGDLSHDSEVQSGADRTSFFGAAVPLSVMEQMHPVWNEFSLKSGNKPAASLDSR